MASSTSVLGMMSDIFLGEVTKKLKEILGFKSLTHTSSSLWRNKRNIFPGGTEDTVKRTKTSPAGEKEMGGGSQGKVGRHGAGPVMEGCNCPNKLNSAQSTRTQLHKV